MTTGSDRTIRSWASRADERRGRAAPHIDGLRRTVRRTARAGGGRAQASRDPSRNGGPDYRGRARRSASQHRSRRPEADGRPQPFARQPVTNLGGLCPPSPLRVALLAVLAMFAGAGTAAADEGWVITSFAADIAIQP